MILIGDKNIPYEKIFTITNKKEIDKTSPNSTVMFAFDISLMKYCKENNINYCVKISTIKDAIYANALEAKYLICEKDLSFTIQKIAEEYMFDTKVLAIIEDEDEIEQIALKGIDGAIYQRLI